GGLEIKGGTGQKNRHRFRGRQLSYPLIGDLEQVVGGERLKLRRERGGARIGQLVSMHLHFQPERLRLLEKLLAFLDGEVALIDENVASFSKLLGSDFGEHLLEKLLHVLLAPDALGKRVSAEKGRLKGELGELLPERFHDLERLELG